MPFIEQAMDQAHEQDLVPEAEYDLRITQHEVKENSKGTGDNIMCVIEIENPPEGVAHPAPIFHYITLVNPSDDAKSKDFKLRMMRRFLEVFSIPFEANGFNDDDLDGATGRCLVTQQEIKRDDKPSGEYTHALRLPKFSNEPEEAEVEQGRGSRRRRRG